MLYPDDASLPDEAEGLHDWERRTWRECANQVYRLKHNWGYGRRAPEESRELANRAAWLALQVHWRHEPMITVNALEIPRVLHRVVPERTGEREDRWWSQFSEMNPDWMTIEWRDPLDPQDWPIFGPLWRKARNGAQLADMIRAEALLKFGGVYVDSDVQPLRPLEDLRTTGAFLAWEDETTVPNAVMGFSQGHPAVRALVALMQQRLPGPTWWAGPGATTLLAWRPDVTVLPSSSFYPVHYKDPQRDAKFAIAETHAGREELLAAFPKSYGIHHYAGSWTRR